MVLALASVACQALDIALMKYFLWPWIGALALVSPLHAIAEEATTLTPSSAIKLTPPSGARLGAWLTQNHSDLAAGMYAPGTMWLDIAEAENQAREKAALLIDISAATHNHPQLASQLGVLQEMLSNMPVTGRKRLFLQDPWLMQAHAGLEPMASPGDQWVITGRSDRVRVIQAQSPACDVKAEPARWAIDYLKACGVDMNTDTVWLIQPDGEVTRLHVGAWNAQAQEAPAPGAWLWVPVMASDDMNRRVAKLVASQGTAQGKGTTVILSEQHSPTPRDLPIFANDWGVTGLLQTPSARTPSEGHVSLTASRVWPYTHTTLTLSPFDSLEVGMRYTNISNRLYGPSIAGDQSYKDKSSEIKWRMLDETATQPAIAMGLRDPGGTGLFAGEYVVTSKRWNSLDISLGLGWGYLGSRGNLSNPLRVLSQRFATRQNSAVGTGGTAQFSPMFTGPTALFGGVQWQTPMPDLVLKIELDGNNYKNEPLANEVGGVRSPLNWGLAWQNGPLKISLGYERGQQWMLSFTLNTDLSKMTSAKRSEPAAWPVTKPVFDASRQRQHPVPTPWDTALPSTQMSVTLPDSSVTDAIAAQTGWTVHGFRQEDKAWIIELDNALGFSLPERLDRGMAVVHELAPDHIRVAHFVMMQQGVPVSSRRLERAAWANARYAWRGQAASHQSGPVATEWGPTQYAKVQKPSGNVGLGYQQHVGGPDGYLYSLNATAQGQWPLWTGAWAQATAKARLIDNYDKYRYTAPSNLPRVRTYVREYLSSERITLPNMQVNQLKPWGDGLYSLVYAGALESMFAGVGAEVMWRPLDSQWAFGADMNRLAQRDFDQRFSLRDYRVNSGHITAYWDTRWQGVEAKLMVGQYLAGDRGATVEIARRFNNGARMGAWVTKTNVSSSAFGEGSFDKGVFVSIPFDAFLTAWSTQSVNVAWQPLIRDGGARLNKAQTLWNLTNSRDEREWSSEPARFSK
jgi:hypothetical protein